MILDCSEKGISVRGQQEWQVVGGASRGDAAEVTEKPGRQAEAF